MTHRIQKRATSLNLDEKRKIAQLSPFADECVWKCVQNISCACSFVNQAKISFWCWKREKRKYWNVHHISFAHSERLDPDSRFPTHIQAHSSIGCHFCSASFRFGFGILVVNVFWGRKVITCIIITVVIVALRHVHFQIERRSSERLWK